MNKTRIQDNIWKYGFLIIFDKRIYVAILSLYFLSVQGVVEYHIGWILLAGSVAAFLFEIPSGYLSDKIGHKKTLVLSRIFFIISTASFLFSINIYMLIAGQVFLNLGIACTSGTAAAFMYDTLKELGLEKQFSKIMGKIDALGFSFPPLIMAGSSVLAAYDYRYIFIICLFLDICGLITALSLTQVEQSAEYKEDVKKTTLKQVVKEAFKLNYMPYAVLGSFFAGVLIGIRGYVDPFQEISGADVAYFGMFLAVSRVFSAVLALSSAKIKSIFTIFSFNIFRTVMFAVLFIVCFFVQSWQAVVGLMMLISTINLGLNAASNHFDLEIIGQSKFKATLISFKGQILQIFLGLIVMSMGYAITYIGYNATFASVGIVILVFSSICLLYIRNKK